MQIFPSSLCLLKGKLQTQLHSKLIFSLFLFSLRLFSADSLLLLLPLSAVASSLSALFLSFSFLLCRLSSVGGGPPPRQVNPISISYDTTSFWEALPCCALIQVLNWGVMKRRSLCCMLPMWQGVSGAVWCRTSGLWVWSRKIWGL